ncbi:hypothetical protein FJZ22_02760 [Candidatus Pacearchaeota archaeon]|nr:hypothetical protein [Candidatus Pacearchaeota archaeon]
MSIGKNCFLLGLLFILASIPFTSADVGGYSSSIKKEECYKSPADIPSGMFGCFAICNANPLCIDPPEEIKEEVTCYFQNSDGEQECYVSDKVEARCKGVSQCSNGVYAGHGKQITWKSTCGGYQYTIQDGNNEKVIFECGKGKTNSSLITGGFRFAHWQCYNGEKEKSGSESSCKPSGLWKKYAKEFCVNKCDSAGKCGVNSFSIGESCYFDGEDVAEEPESVTLLPIENTLALDKETLVCKDSCPLDGKCYQFGYRKSGDFCSDSGSFEKQFKEEAKCENNFECGSNVCVNSKCVSQGFIESIIAWFKRLFGG